MAERSDSARFAEMALPHLDAAYNLARWLAREPADAADIVQEAMARALKFFGSFRGGDGKAWLLTIVRNTAYSWLKTNRPAEIALSGANGGLEDALASFPSPEDSPETAIIRAGEQRRIDRLIAALPAEYRECLILREMEELSYKEIAAITGVPIGTVMSRLARARQSFRQAWQKEEAA